MKKPYQFNFYSCHMNQTLTAFLEVSNDDADKGFEISRVVVKASRHSDEIIDGGVRDEAREYFKTHLKEDLDNQS